MGYIILILAVDLLVFGPVGAWLAQQKGRSGTEGFIVGAILGILGILALGLAPNAHPTTRACPRCAEQVMAAASICRYCGLALTPEEVAANSYRPSKVFLIIVTILVVLIVLLVVKTPR